MPRPAVKRRVAEVEETPVEKNDPVEPASDLSPEDVEEPDPEPVAKKSSRRPAKKAPSPKKKPVIEEKEDEEEEDEEKPNGNGLKTFGDDDETICNSQVDDMDVEPDPAEEEEKKEEESSKKKKKTRFQLDSTDEEKKGSDSDFVPSSAAVSDEERDRAVAEAAGGFADYVREAEEEKAAIIAAKEVVVVEEEIWDHPTDALKKKMPTYFRNIDPALFKLVVTKKDGDYFITIRHPKLRKLSSIVFPFVKVAFDNCFPYGNCQLFAKHKDSPYNAVKVDQSKYGLMVSLGAWSEAHDGDPELMALEEWMREVDRVIVEQSRFLPNYVSPKWREEAKVLATTKARERYEMLRNSANAVMSRPGATIDSLSGDMLEAFQSKSAPEPTDDDVLGAYMSKYSSPLKPRENEDATMSFEKYVFTRLNDKKRELAKQGKYEYHPPDPFTKMLYERHHLVLSDLPLITLDGRKIPFLARDCPQGSIVSVRAFPRFMRESPQGVFGLRWVMDAIIFYRGPEDGDQDRAEMHARAVQDLGLAPGGDYDENQAKENNRYIYNAALAAIKSTPALVSVSDPKAQKQIANK